MENSPAGWGLEFLMQEYDWGGWKRFQGGVEGSGYPRGRVLYFFINVHKNNTYLILAMGEKYTLFSIHFLKCILL